MKRATFDPNQLLESIDLDGPRSTTLNSLVVKEELPSKPKPLMNVGIVLGYRKAPLKPEKFDSTGLLESFVAQFI